MWVNNEVGNVQPVGEIAARCRSAGVAFHTDAVQAFGKLRVRLDETPCDLLTLSAHKTGGPMGIGALFVRRGVEVAPLEHGGSQEASLRPGTENVAAAVGFAVAAELAAREQEGERARLAALRDRLEAGLRARIPDAVVNGAGGERAPQTLNLSVPGVQQEVLLMSLDMEGIACSGGSACQSGAIEPSHVLVAMGRALPNEAAVRLSLGRATTEAEVEAAIERFPAVVEKVRALALLSRHRAARPGYQSRSIGRLRAGESGWSRRRSWWRCPGVWTPRSRRRSSSSRGIASSARP
jgi:cysteine desulfurase